MTSDLSMVGMWKGSREERDLAGGAALRGGGDEIAHNSLCYYGLVSSGKLRCPKALKTKLCQIED